VGGHVGLRIADCGLRISWIGVKNRQDVKGMERGGGVGSRGVVILGGKLWRVAAEYVVRLLIVQHAFLTT
jgi:hypothetical protein